MYLCGVSSLFILYVYVFLISLIFLSFHFSRLHISLIPFSAIHEATRPEIERTAHHLYVNLVINLFILSLLFTNKLPTNVTPVYDEARRVFKGPTVHNSPFPPLTAHTPMLLYFLQ